MIKILIADDSELLRTGLKTILEHDAEIEVCALASNGDEAFELCRIHMPDLVLMDMKMPICNGEAATKKIKQAYPAIKVLVLTTFDDKDTIDAALSSGADGYILKNVDEDRIVQAIKSTLVGISVLGTGVFDNIKNRYFSINTESEQLSDREKEIMVYISKGYTNKEIAKEMLLAVGTVRNHVSSLLFKLHMTDRTQLAVFAIRNGFC